MQFPGPSIHLIHLKKNPLILAFAKKKVFFSFFMILDHCCCVLKISIQGRYQLWIYVFLKENKVY